MASSTITLTATDNQSETSTQNWQITVTPGTLLHRIVGKTTMQVNSSHHQAVRDPGRRAIINAVAPDGVIEGIEDPRHRFCLGVQWHPEFFIDPGDRRIFDALIAACRP